MTIFHKFVATKRGGIITNLTLRNHWGHITAASKYRNIREQFEFIIQSNGSVLYQFTGTAASQHKVVGPCNPNVPTQFYINLHTLYLFNNSRLFRWIYFRKSKKNIWICHQFSLLGRVKNTFIIHGWYHDGWRPSDASNQGISSEGLDLIWNVFSSFVTRGPFYWCGLI